MSKFINVEDLEKHKMKSGLAPGGGVAAGWNACIKYIQREVPEADVRENVHGEWTHRTNHTQTCSVCGSRIYEREDYNFCPVCGADMRGGKE